VQVSALAAGRLQRQKKDTLFVGTSTDLLAYDVERNRDVFFKDVYDCLILHYFMVGQLPDGASSIVVGTVGSIDEPLVLCGGNCSIQGFDASGQDQFWTV
jgi:Bardet-Biedl syndrome 2 protein